MKKAQINQAFIYIAAILVIGIIIFVAAKGWNVIFKTNCEVQRADFEKSIFEAIDKYSDYGTVKEVSFLTPCDALTVCFGDASVNTVVKGGELDDVIFSNMNSGTANVFVKTKFTEALGFSPEIRVDDAVQGDHVMCAEVKGGRVKLRFSGQGKTVMIEDAYS